MERVQNIQQLKEYSIAAADLVLAGKSEATIFTNTGLKSERLFYYTRSICNDK